MKSVSLFSGINGLSVGTPILYCDVNKHAVEVLEARMRDGSIPTAPIYSDVCLLENLPTEVEIITAGFPCTDISSAGLKAGLTGERSGLFFHVVRLAQISKTPFVFLENVNNFRMLPDVWKTVLLAMHSIGYDSHWITTTSEQVGAPHLRRRWFCLCTFVGDRCPAHNHEELTRAGRKMYPCGTFVDGKYCKSHPVVAGEKSSINLLLTPLLGKRKCQSTDMVTRPLKRSRFPTPRANGGSFCANGLTHRCSYDLATVLRFEKATKEDERWVRHGRPSPAFVEWMMGFPDGWTNPDISLTGQTHNNWTREPMGIPRLAISNIPSSHRLFLLGNACVPAQGRFAWKELYRRVTGPKNQLLGDQSPDLPVEKGFTRQEKKTTTT